MIKNGKICNLFLLFWIISCFFITSFHLPSTFINKWGLSLIIATVAQQLQITVQSNICRNTFSNFQYSTKFLLTKSAAIKITKIKYNVILCFEPNALPLIQLYTYFYKAVTLYVKYVCIFSSCKLCIALSYEWHSKTKPWITLSKWDAWFC